MISSVDQLVSALRCLPGVGPKSAQRLAYHLLQKDRVKARLLAESLLGALDNLQHCIQCNDFSPGSLCEKCSSTSRDSSILCVVETPIDMTMLEQTLAFNGLYYILMGRISPLDGIGPKQLGVQQLLQRALDGRVKEVILATNFTNEGEATAHYVESMLANKGLTVSRIARGVPVGGELEFVDSGTLAQAIRERRNTRQ